MNSDHIHVDHNSLNRSIHSIEKIKEDEITSYDEKVRK